MTSIPWENVSGAGGGFDQIKLAVVLVSTALAFMARPRRAGGWSGGNRLMIVYATIAAVGGYFTGPFPEASVQRAGRYFLTVCAIVWIVRRLGARRTLRTVLALVMIECILSLGSFAVGAASYWNGRLAGYWPNMHPNLLGALAAVGLAAGLICWGQGWIRGRWAFMSALILAGTLIATGSRTSLAAAAAVMVMFVFAGGRIRRRVFAGWALLIIVLAGLAAYSVAGINVVDKVATRGGSTVVDLTFTGRTLAWDSAIHAHAPGQQAVFGQGLAVKDVGVDSEFVDFATVDGSWHAAYLQTGWLGVSALAAAFLLMLGGMLRRGRYLLPLAGLLIVQSVMESQINDIGVGMTLTAAALVLVTPPRKDPSTPSTAPLRTASVTLRMPR